MALMDLSQFDMTIPPGPPYVVVDVETTGLSPYHDKIIQLAAIRFEDNKPVAYINTYVDPHRPVPAEATAVNGITDDALVGAPAAEDIRERFAALIDGAMLLGWNVGFDLQFLDQAFPDLLSGASYIDVMEMAGCIGDLPDHTLETAAAFLGFVPPGGFHDALADCWAAAMVYFATFHAQLFKISKQFVAHHQSSSKLSRFKSFRPGDVVPTVAVVPQDHPFSGKSIVFTGELSVGRVTAATMAANVGALISGSVSRKTGFLVVVTQDPTIVGADGISTKERRARELNETGKATIKILTEDEFFALLEGAQNE